jgi:hypothetical protein
MISKNNIWPGSLVKLTADKVMIERGYIVRNSVQSIDGKIINRYDLMLDPDALGLAIKKFPNDLFGASDRHWVILFKFKLYVVSEKHLGRCSKSRKENKET